MGVRTIRAALYERVAIAAVVAALELFIAISFLRALARGTVGGVEDAWPALPMVLLAGFLAVRYWFVGLFITPDHVIVRNMTTTRRVPRTLVVGIGIRESPVGIRQLY